MCYNASNKKKRYCDCFDRCKKKCHCDCFHCKKKDCYDYKKKDCYDYDSHDCFEPCKKMPEKKYCCYCCCWHY